MRRYLLFKSEEVLRTGHLASAADVLKMTELATAVCGNQSVFLLAEELAALLLIAYAQGESDAVAI